MAKRNDTAAVRKAATEVDRQALASVLRHMLADRLPKRKARRAILPNVGDTRWNADRMRRERWDGSAWEPVPTPVPTTPSTPSAPTRRRRTRASFTDKMRKVTERPFGDWPRYGTARSAKARVVRDKLKELGGETTVGRLLGLRYEHEGKYGAITMHDLEVMVDKALIRIEGE